MNARCDARGEWVGHETQRERALVVLRHAAHDDVVAVVIVISLLCAQVAHVSGQLNPALADSRAHAPAAIKSSIGGIGSSLPACCGRQGRRTSVTTWRLIAREEHAPRSSRGTARTPSAKRTSGATSAACTSPARPALLPHSSAVRCTADHAACQRLERDRASKGV